MGAASNVRDLPNQTAMVCPGCGTPSGCQCGRKPITRAEYAVRQHPEKSDHMLSNETGLDRRTLRKARKRQLEHDAPVGKRTGLDGKTRKMPTASTPKPVGWTVAVEAEFGGALPSGFSRNTLAQEKKPRVEAAHGSAIPKCLMLGSAEARAVADTIRRMYAEARPREVIAESRNAVEATRADVRETDRARFERLLAKAREAQHAELRAGYFQAVQTEVEKRLPNEARRQIESALESVEAAQEVERVWRHRSSRCLAAMKLFIENWRSLIGCLHPDRSEHLTDDERRKRMGAATDIVTRTRKLIEETDYEHW